MFYVQAWSSSTLFVNSVLLLFPDISVFAIVAHRPATPFSITPLFWEFSRPACTERVLCCDNNLYFRTRPCFLLISKGLSNQHALGKDVKLVRKRASAYLIAAPQEKENLQVTPHQSQQRPHE
jgi:hypothetical protein